MTTLEKLEELIYKGFKETDRYMRETDRKIRENFEQTDREIRQLSKEVDRVSKEVGKVTDAIKQGLYVLAQSGENIIMLNDLTFEPRVF